jgi:hypothetical protein
LERTFQIAQRNGLGHVLTNPDLAARWQAMQPKPTSRVVAASPIVAASDTRTSEGGPARGKAVDKPNAVTKSQTEPLVTAPPANPAPRPAAANGSGRAINADSVPPPKSADHPPYIRAAVRAREAEVLKRSWAQAFAKLEDMERLPVRDEAGRWTIDTEGLSLPERRALSDPERAAETQKRLARMVAVRVEREREAARNAETAKMAVQESSRTASSNKVAGPEVGRQPRRVPPILSKGPDDVTVPPPGGGRAGPGR